MKAFIRAILSTAVTCLVAVGAPAPWYTSDGLVTSSPQIDALVWTNRGTFSAANLTVYDTQNTVRYVNNGDLSAFPGFRFETISDTGERSPALEFINNRILSSEAAVHPT